MNTYTCQKCSDTKETKRPPMGWKLLADGESIVCKACKGSNYVQRVVSLPVVAVVGANQKPWEPFRHPWDLATSLANWLQRELLRHDAIREPGMGALPKYDGKMFRHAWSCLTPTMQANIRKKNPDKTYAATDMVGVDLYGHWSIACPFRGEFDGAAGSASTILRAVESRWKGHKEQGRFAVLWKRDTASPTARWPQPWVVRRSDYRLSLVGGVPHVEMSLPGGRVTVRLDNAAGWRRDARRFGLLVSGEATAGDLKVMAKFRDGKLVGVMLRISGLFPAAQQESDEEREAIITTTAENLLVVQVAGQEPFVFCGDDVVGKQAAYDRWRQRAATDLKHEKRWPKPKRRKMVLSNQQAAINAANRVKTCIEQLVSMVVGHECKRTGRMVPGYVLRQRVATVIYNDECKEFIRRFEWHTLREKMRQRCAETGVRFIHDGERAGADESPVVARSA
jgi:hypothetical protein